MLAREALSERVRFGVDDEVDLALPIERHVLRPVPGDRAEAHGLEQSTQRHGIGRGVFDELESIRAHRVVPGGELHGALLRCGGFDVAQGRIAL